MHWNHQMPIGDWEFNIGISYVNEFRTDTDNHWALWTPSQSWASDIIHHVMKLSARWYLCWPENESVNYPLECHKRWMVLLSLAPNPFFGNFANVPHIGFHLQVAKISKLWFHIYSIHNLHDQSGSTCTSFTLLIPSKHAWMMQFQEDPIQDLRGGPDHPGICPLSQTLFRAMCNPTVHKMGEVTPFSTI